MCEPTQAGRGNNPKPMVEMQKINAFSLPLEPGDIRSSALAGAHQRDQRHRGFWSLLESEKVLNLLLLPLYQGFLQLWFSTVL